MPTRRDALKTLAGATVVGSLSGCVQFATQSTVEYRGTPAWIVQSETRGGLATAVGVEGRTTVKRAGITREIVTHNWGMLYEINIRRQGAVGTLATFTTPSITIAGQELNPIKDLTVSDIGSEFVNVALAGDDGEEIMRSSVGGLESTTVEDATGRKVLRAFRDSVGGSGDGDIDLLSIDREDLHIETGQPIPEKVIPEWDGDTYNLTLDGKGNDVRVGIRFDRHDGDYVVLFETRTVSGTGGDLLGLPITDGNDSGFYHPPDDDFTQEMLQRHLIETNLQGMQGLLEQSRMIIDETQDLLGQAENDTRDEEDDRFSVITATEDDLEELDTVLGGLGEDFQSITGGSGDDTLNRRVRERSEEAATIATRAHERIANYNDTRDEEDDRFVQIEDNLGALRKITRFTMKKVKGYMTAE